MLLLLLLLLLPLPAAAFLEVAPATKPCVITQCGKTGFGHLLSGAWSLMAAAHLAPRSFVYVHTPFARLDIEHAPGIGPRADAAFGFEETFAVFPGGHAERPRDETAFVLAPCVGGPGSVFCLNNAWPLTHSAEHLASVEILPLFDRLRAVYWRRNPDPPPGFSRARPNVVVHVRRGDAVERRAPLAFFLEAVRVARREFPDALFHVLTDDLLWEGLLHLLGAIGEGNARVASPDPDGVLDAMHAVAAANASILSYSSMGYAMMPFARHRNFIVEARKYDDVLGAFVERSRWITHRIKVP